VKRESKLVGIVSKPLQKRYRHANESERQRLHEVIERESRWMIDKMARKGYQLEGRVGGVYGLFTRGSQRGSLRLEAELARASS
jgi:hypothetical protein